MNRVPIFCLFFLVLVAVNGLPKHDIRNSGTKHQSQVQRRTIPIAQTSHSSKHGIKFLDQKLSPQVKKTSDDKTVHIENHEEEHENAKKERINPNTKIITPDMDDAAIDEVLQEERKENSVPDVKPKSPETGLKNPISDKVKGAAKSNNYKSTSREKILPLPSSKELKDESSPEELKPSPSPTKLEDNSVAIDSVKDISASKESVKDNSASKESVKDISASKESVRNTSTSKESVKNNSASKESVKDNSASKESVKDNSASKESVKDNLASKESVRNTSASKESVKNNLASNESMKDNSVAKDEPTPEKIKDEASAAVIKSFEPSIEDPKTQDSQHDSSSYKPKLKDSQKEDVSSSNPENEEVVPSPQGSIDVLQMKKPEVPTNNSTVAQNSNPSSNKLNKLGETTKKKTLSSDTENENLKQKTPTIKNNSLSSKQKKLDNKLSKVGVKNPKVDLPPLAMHPENSHLINIPNANNTNDKTEALKPKPVLKTNIEKEKDETTVIGKYSIISNATSFKNLKSKNPVTKINTIDEEEEEEDEIRAEAKAEYENSAKKMRRQSEENEGSYPSNHRGLLYATLGLIGITLVVTVIGAYYKKLSFGSGRYSHHYPLSTEDDDSIFLTNRRADVLDSHSTDYDSWKEFSAAR